MKLVSNYFGKDQHSFDVLREFETAVRQSGVPDARMVLDKFWARATYYLWDFQKKAGLQPFSFSRLFPADSQETYFTILMGPHFKRCFPYFHSSARKSLYMFDAWPAYHAQIKGFVETFQVGHLFVSSSQAAAQLQELLPQTVCSWIPEGVDPTQYTFRAPEEKDIDVLSMGRKHDDYHVKIRDGLAIGGKQYLYEKSWGEVIFPTQAAFLDGLARTKISICIPKSITHPELAQGTETLTNRYLQSMAAKCLIVGHAPEEMVRLFGYNPVVEIDWADPAGQLLDLLTHYDDYSGLIERNYAEVHEKHTWKHRWAQIYAVLQGRPQD